MVVDDEYYVRLGIRETIDWGSYGVELVCEAEDGRKGLELALRFLPDIIITDIKMPGMDGFEFYAAFKQQPEFASCFTVMLTTSQNARDLEQARALGIPYFLTKPLTPQKLNDIIQLHTNRKQANGEN